MLRRSLVLLCLLVGASSALHAQATPAASKLGDLQIGAGYVRGQPDYSPLLFNGFAVYGDFDVVRHFGVEAGFHRIAGGGNVSITETSYDAGIRYRYPIGPFSPYAKILVGRGSFSYGNSYQNGGYGLYAGGGGIDYRVTPRVVIRADYEYQRWGNFPPRGLQPNLFTLGAAYRFR